MARYHFESTLTPDQIRMRISVYAKEAKPFGWQFGPSAFYYRFRRSASFFLVKTHATRFGAVRGQPVFLGTLREKNGLTHIDGRFGWQYWRFDLAFLAVSLLISFLGHNVLPSLGAVLFLLMKEIIYAAGALLYHEEEQAVLNLIETHLLS